VHAQHNTQCEAAQLLAHANRRACLAEQGSLGPKKRRRETPERVPVRRRVLGVLEDRAPNWLKYPTADREEVGPHRHTSTHSPSRPAQAHWHTRSHRFTKNARAQHKASGAAPEQTGAQAHRREGIHRRTDTHMHTQAHRDWRPTVTPAPYGIKHAQKWHQQARYTGDRRTQTPRRTGIQAHRRAAHRHTGSHDQRTQLLAGKSQAASQKPTSQRKQNQEQRSPRLPRGSFWDS
jgi:hypothetical protein